MDFWVDKPDRFVEDLDELAREELIDQHFNFTNGNGVALIKLFLTTKFPINIDYINRLSDPCFDNQGDGQDFLSQINSKKAQMESKFNSKYKNMNSLKKVLREEKQILTARSNYNPGDLPTNHNEYR